MKNFVHKITCVLVMCAATVAFTACSDSDNKGDGPVTGTLSVETGALKFTSGAYSKGFEVETDGTVGAIQVDVNYKGAETGWITAKVNDGDVVVTVARNTGDARTADVVLSAKGAESVTVSISQKAVFSSDLVGRYTPYVPDPENPIANFFINPVYADMDPEKVPQIVAEHIVNGHVPVREKNGESPIKGGGRLVVIDGGFCRAYHEKTGIAGYTLVYSSRTMSLRTHQPFESAEKAVKDNLDIISQKNILETENHRILVEDTDEGEVLRERVHDLKQLVAAYQLGWITETRCEDHIW